MNFESTIYVIRIDIIGFIDWYKEKTYPENELDDENRLLTTFLILVLWKTTLHY